MDYYIDLFTRSRLEHLEKVAEVILEVVTPEMNVDLTRDFTAMEVEVD